MFRFLYLKIIFILIVWFFEGHKVFAQKYNYVAYTTRDGLAGNMVYDMLQTEDGFIWFGTDNGLSRFDGKNFKNYSVKDGLPDNEVLSLFEDSQKRLWIGTFSNHFCYFQNGKFYRSGFDTVFSGLQPKSRPTFFYEDTLRSFWIFCEKNIYRWKLNDSLKELQFTPPLTERVKSVHIYPMIAMKPKRMFLGFNDSIFIKNADGSLSFFGTEKLKSSRNYIYESTKNYSGRIINIGVDIISYKIIGEEIRFLSKVNGAYELDYSTKQKVDSFLLGKAVTKTIVDKEGIHWFSTLGDGVFKLVSKYSKVFAFHEGVNASNEVFSIGFWKDNIITGHGGSRMLVWNERGISSEKNFSRLLNKVETSNATNRLRVIKKLDEKTAILGFDSYIVKWNGSMMDWLPLAAIKSIEFVNKDSLLIASGTGVYQIAKLKFKNPDTIWTSRATYAVKYKKDFFVGTLNGLYKVDENRSKSYLGDLHPTLKRRITGIKSIGNIIWVATSDSGLVALQNGKVVTALSEKDGLSSNICRVLETDGVHLWVGTNKGLNKLTLSGKQPQIRIYNSYNVLPGNAISSILIKDSKLYIGTPEGLTVFEETFFKKNLFCNVHIDGAKVGDSFYSKSEIPIVTRKSNRIEFFLSGISTQAAGDINFVFKLEGFEDEWHSGTDPTIVYNNLPAGSYVFKVRSENIFGAKSVLASMKIEVVSPFWYSYKFWIVITIVAAIISGFLIYRNAKKRQRKLEQQMDVERQMASLEQKALQSQMNPHFIFNSLNSIQQYIITNNVKDANKYLTIFGGLIRETMEFSSLGSISLEMEIKYLQKYLQLEQMRFGHKFQFEISTDELVNKEAIQIPALLLQPFVENSIRHGVRYLKDEKGLIQIVFQLENGKLICKVIDNGIGRKASMAQKTKQHIEYQSRGMELTEKRINMLNKIYGEKVSMEVCDLGQMGTDGTEVTLTIKLDHGYDA